VPIEFPKAIRAIRARAFSDSELGELADSISSAA
jgi:hypothetical protein